MKTIEIQNWRFGLDTRRTSISSNLGTLTTLENAFVNQGAEIESRKAFVKLGTLSVNCFDILALSTGMVTFGSTTNLTAVQSNTRTRANNIATIRLVVGNWFFLVGDVVTITGLGGIGYNLANVTITAVNANTISYACPGADEALHVDAGGTVTKNTSIITYQRLRHPWVGLIGDGLFDPAMTGVTASCSFNNKAVVSASFAAYNGSIIGSDYSSCATTIMFNDGTAVVQHYLGSVLVTTGHRSGAIADQQIALANELVASIPSYFDTTFVGQEVTNPTIGAYVSLTGPVDEAFTLTTNYTTATTKTFTQDQTIGTVAAPEVIAVGATNKFYLVSGAGGQITSLVDNAAVALITAAVPYNASLFQTALDLVAAINARTGTTGYTAAATLYSTKVAEVTLTAPASAGATPATPVVITTTTIHVSLTTPPDAGATGAQNLVLAGGVNGVAAQSQVSYLLFDGTNSLVGWNYNDTWGFVLTLNNIFYTVGNGNITQKVPSFMLPLANKVYFTYGVNVNFSKVNDATGWEQQDSGAGFLLATDQYSNPSNTVALAPYQGRLAVFCNSTISIWQINADPTQYAVTQTLNNIGTIAAQSVQPLGDLDVIFLANSGFRSLRVRDSSLNAVTTDIGSPVDSLVVTAIRQGLTNVCAVLEPTSNTYWCYLNDGNIYVLSYFPALKIEAWSTFKPTDQNGATFVPKKMVVYNQQVYILDTNNNVYVYGGANNNTYDGSVVTVITPWLDDKKPSMYKGYESVDVGMQGKWTLYAGCDPTSGTLEQIFTYGTAATPDPTKDSTFDIQTISYIANGTHFRLKAVSDATNIGVIKLASLLLKYEPQNEK